MTVSVADVHKALHELGSLRFGEMEVEDAMRSIVQTTHAIFDVDAAGLMLADEEQHLRNVSVSDDRFAHLEDLQVRHGEGPCLSAYADKELVCAEDLNTDERWPTFSRAATQRGIHAVLASPIPFNQQPVGVVAVMSEDRHPWSPEGELALMAFTDLAALLIASMMHGQQQSALAGQLQGALDSRTVVEQAKGVLMAQHGLTPREAYERLRAEARSKRRKLAEVAGEVVEAASRSGRSSSG
ncbi:MAG: ANTAR domain-containing protein [bacterium]